jgi:hypothetical protein
MTLQRIQLLNKIGFTWDDRELQFEEQYKVLLEFYGITGHWYVKLIPNIALRPGWT